MKTIESNLPVSKTKRTSCASLYFLNNIVVVEIDRHTILGNDQVVPILNAIEAEFLDLTQVHYISNRTEIYSLKPLDLTRVKERIDLFKSYSVVTYGISGHTNLVFERMFLKKPIVRHDSLEAAVGVAMMMDDRSSGSFSVA